MVNTPDMNLENSPRGGFIVLPEKYLKTIQYVASNSLHKNLWLLIICFYVVPIVASCWMIIKRGHLLGDFAFVRIDPSIKELLLVAFLYVLPGLIFILSINIFYQFSKFSIKKRVFDQYWNENVNRINTLFPILVASTIGAAIFGLPTISGGSVDSEFTFFQNFILYLNPSLLFLIIAISNPSPLKLAISSICLLYIGLIQISLLPMFLVVMGISVWLIFRYPLSQTRLIVIITISLSSLYFMQEFIYYLYNLRNSARGAAEIFDIDKLFVYAVGRVNSFSSLYYIFFDDCCSTKTANFYLFGKIIERFTGISFHNYSPSEAFNDTYFGAGYGEYSIFASYAGQFLIDFNNSIVNFFISFSSAAIIIFISYRLMPFPECKEKIPLFFILIFPVYLSGDAWEFSVFFRSLVIINIILFFSSKIGLWRRSH